MYKFNLESKTVVITGGCGLIGEEFVKAFVEEKSNVIILDLSIQKPENLALSFKQDNVIGISCDITNKNDIKKAYLTIKKKFKSIDVLINAVQYKPKGFLSSDIENTSEKLWNDVINVNLTGTFLLCQIFGKDMVKNKSGSIVNLASTYGVVSSNPNLYENNTMGNPIAYTASKGGVIMMSKYLAAHWANKGVRVNCLTPHGVSNNHEDEFIKRFSNLSPMNRLMNKKELIGAILFLSSDASSYMTGENMIVDGGWTSW